MTEAQIERQVVELCRVHQLLTYKFTSPAHRGVPDRIIVGRGKVLFLELKQEGKQPTALQMREIDRINSHAVCEGVKATWAAGVTDALAVVRRMFDL